MPGAGSTKNRYRNFTHTQMQHRIGKIEEYSITLLGPSKPFSFAFVDVASG